MEDKQIIELFTERSERAIMEVSKKYGKVCLRTSFNIVNDWDDAEECVNDSYLGVWNAIPPHKPNPLLAFILKIVRNISINRQEFKMAEKRKGNYEICLDEMEDMISSSHEVEDEVEAAELTKLIEQYLGTLSADNRILFIRRYWFMDSYKDLSVTTRMTEGNIRTKLSRLRAQLKSYLESQGVVV